MRDRETETKTETERRGEAKSLLWASLPDIVHACDFSVGTCGAVCFLSVAALITSMYNQQSA